MANKALDIVSISRLAIAKGISFEAAKQQLSEEARQEALAEKGMKTNTEQNVKAHNRKAREEHYGSLFVAIGTSNGMSEEIFQVKGRFQNRKSIQAEQAITFVQSLDNKTRKGLDLNKIRAFWVHEEAFIAL